jgi:hypothetical protein
VKKSEGRRLLDRSRRRWDDIKMNFREVRMGGGGARTRSILLRIGTGDGLL